MFDKFVGSKGISVQKFYYSSGAEVNEALAAGKINAIMSGNCVLDEDKSWLLNLIICLRISLREKQYGINGAAGSGDAGDNAGKSLFYCRVVREFYGRADKLAKGLPGRNLLISRQPHRCVLSVMPIIIRWNGWTVKRRL